MQEATNEEISVNNLLLKNKNILLENNLNIPKTIKN